VTGGHVISRQRADTGVALVCGAVAAGIAALALEALTDRDWAITGWEWPEVLVADLVLVLGVLWAVFALRTRERAAPVRQVAQAGLEQLGYRVVRIPPLASDPGYALDLDFEYVLADYLGRRDDVRPFTFVQVGAFDGVTHDRLFEHVRERGWHGVLVEPQLRYFQRLVQNYGDLDGLTFINAAVDRERGSRELYCYRDVRGEPLDSVGGLASFSRERLVKALRDMGERAPRGIDIVSTPVRCVTFEDLLADIDYVDLVSIDVEGYDLEILKLFDLARFAPAIIRFEHVHLSRSEWDEAVKLLARHGYRVLREEHDTTAYLHPS